MSDRTTTGEAREALDDLHLAAHENGPTSDLSTHFRRARRLWVAMGGEHRMAYGDPIPAWDDLGAHMQLMLAGLVARAVQDVLEVEQVMYRALVAVLDVHRPVPGTTTDRHGVRDTTFCDCCLDPAYPCPTVTAITTGIEGIMGGGDRG